MRLEERYYLEIDSWLHTFFYPCQHINIRGKTLDDLRHAADALYLSESVATFDNFISKRGNINPCV